MPVVTATFAAISAVMLVMMTLDAARLRRKHKIALHGLGNDKHVNRAVRAHGNFAEHVPLALLLLLILELSALAASALIGLGAALMFGRALHWFGLKSSSGPTLARTLGVGLTVGVLISEAACVVWLTLGAT